MASFEFKGMDIKRLTAHTIFARGTEKELVPPEYADALIELTQEALDLIQVRLVNALGNASHGVEMAIQNTGDASFLQLGAAAIHADDNVFLGSSKTLALKLAEAQSNPRWPGGVVIIVTGEVGQHSKPFIAVIKAETDKGFNVTKKDGKTFLDLVKNMLLSETQRLYKVGLLVEMNTEEAIDGQYAASNYKAFLFDHLLTASETRNAAVYFYSTFLGLDILTSSRRQTQVFFEETKNFISSGPFTDDQRETLREALRAELRSNTPTLSSADFAKTHLPEEHQKNYVEHLTKQGFPAQAIIKDTDYIKHKLRRPRNVIFSSGVMIKVPSNEVFKNLVQISASADGFTEVKIKGTVQERDS